MTSKQQKQFDQFKEFTRWMYGDTELALYLAQTQFLVALGLFNYMETLGAFRLGFFQKEKSGGIKIHNPKNKKCKECPQCINGKLKTTLTERFNNFFSYLGPEYKQLLDAHKEIYDELRCGLSHEFLPKKRPFIIYQAGKNKFTEDQIHHFHSFIDLYADNLTNGLDDSKVNCGVVLFKQNGKEIWQVFVPKLAADFRRGVKKFIREIESTPSLHKNFFETADQINLQHFE